jgi:hypothetical protein
MQQPAALAVLRRHRYARGISKRAQAIVTGTDPLATDIDHTAAQACRPDPAANPIPGLEYAHAVAGLLQYVGTGQAGKARADYQYVGHDPVLRDPARRQAHPA